MLFAYPIAATAENWLHDSLVEMVRTVHAKLDAGEKVPDWPDIIPAEHRADLSSRGTLRDRLKIYETSAKALASDERQRVLTCLGQQNGIANLVSRTADCECLTDLPEAIREPVAELFDFAFALLTTVGVRDRHYQAIYNSAAYHVCPFCGCEYFDAPGAPREDLDHYLAKSRYPFAAANLRNLVPMGMRCNERYKRSQDILRDAAGNRRRAFDPYGKRAIRITLDGSVPFASADGHTPSWQIRFDPDLPECETWDDVFAVRERIERDVLNRRFGTWLGEFCDWCRSARIQQSDDSAVVDAVERWVAFLTGRGLDDRAFLKAAVFGVLLQWCRGGDKRVLDMMRNLVDESSIMREAG